MLMFEQLVTAGETWRDQLDVARLLNTPRRTKRDRIYSVNDKYGFGRSLKLYAEMPETAPIFGIIPHGVSTYGCLAEKPEAPKQELIAKIPCIFTSGERCFDAFWNAGKRNLFPIGLSSIYTNEFIKEEKLSPKGSLFFRSHSTQSVVDSLDDEQVIKWLKSLSRKFYPINISVFPFDYKRGIYKRYEEAGFRLVCAGAEYDEGFIWRHLHLIRSHRYILGTGMGTHVFHSIMCGRPVLIRRMNENYSARHPDFQKRIEHISDFNNLAEKFCFELEEPNRQQIKLASYFLGLKNLASPETLRRFIELAQRIHERSIDKAASAFVVSLSPIDKR